VTRASAIALAITLLAIAGCAGNGPRSPSVSSGGSETYRGAPSGRPLAAYAGQRVAVLPLQSVRRDDALGWGAQLGSSDTTLAAVDTAVARAMKERGLGAWVGAAAVARAARMNPTYAPDPHSLPLALLAPAERRPDIPIADPLASQLRTLAALSDARFLLLPLQLRVEPRQQDGKTTGGRAVLELALIDARLAQLLWRGSVSSDVAAAFSPALATEAAARVPDLVVAR
jgi:hypothetical protein